MSSFDCPQHLGDFIAAIETDVKVPVIRRKTKVTAMSLMLSRSSDKVVVQVIDQPCLPNTW